MSEPQCAAAILEVLVAFDGTFETEIGQVLNDISMLSGVPYKEVSRCVLLLEADGLVEVTRFSHPEGHQGNRVVRIQLVYPERR